MYGIYNVSPNNQVYTVISKFNYEFLFPKLNIKKKNKTTKGLSNIVLLRPPCNYACALESHLYCLARYIRRLCNAQYLGSHGWLKYPHLIAERWLRGKEISKKISMTKDTSVTDSKEVIWLRILRNSWHTSHLLWNKHKIIINIMIIMSMKYSIEVYQRREQPFLQKHDMFLTL